MPGPVNVPMQQVGGSDYNFQGSQQLTVTSGTTTLTQPLNLNAPVPPGYPNTSPNTPTGVTQDGSGNSYTTGMNLGTPITLSLVRAIATISAPSGQTLPSPLTITVTLTYGGGLGLPKAD